MNFIQFVAPLIGGYWFLWTWNYTKFVVREDSGYHLFFKSSLAGIFFLILANLLIFVVNCFNLKPNFKYFEAAGELIPNGFEFASILALTMGIVFAYALNWCSSAKKELARAAEDRGNYLFLMIQEAFDKSIMMEVTLNSGKVYIGSTLSEIPFESEYLRLIPYFSGYRAKETKQLIISRKYAEEIKSILDASSIKPIGFDQSLSRKFRVIVPTKDITSARLFYPDIFEKLNDEKLSS